MSWRRAAVVVGLITIMTVFFQHSRDDSPSAPVPNLRMLTTEETVGLAFYAGTPPSVMRRANPKARNTLFSLLSDPAQSVFHPQVADCLGYVCESSDISAIEEEVERRATIPATLVATNDKSVVSVLCMALAIMDSRKIVGSAEALRSMTSESYWNDLGAVYFPVGGETPLMTDADIFVGYAVTAYAWTDRQDVDDVVAAALTATTGARRQAIETSLQRRITEAQQRKELFNQSDDEETHKEWVAGLQKCWNNDLSNPLPTATRRFPAVD